MSDKTVSIAAEATERARVEAENLELLRRATSTDIENAGIRNGMSPAQQVAALKLYRAAQG